MEIRMAWSRGWQRTLLLALVVFSFLLPVSAETRSALIIGNDGYKAATPLKNARNDARAMAAELEKLGFEVVLTEDASAPQLESTIRSWTGGLKDTDVALFFYAGHGVQVEGINYLVPVDFDGDEIDVKHSCLSAEMIRERMEKSGPETNIIVLDACRNNPFSSTRGGSRGLVFMEGGVGTLIAFSTSPGGVSDDNPDGRNGLFTKHLLLNLATPGMDVLQVFQNVGRGVYADSHGSQKPWISASVMPKSFCFVPASASSLPQTRTETGGPTATETAPVATISSVNFGRLPRQNVVLLLVAEDSSRTAWILDLAKQRITEWYGGGRTGIDVNLTVDFVSYRDKNGRALAEQLGIKESDLPAMASAVKKNGRFEKCVSLQKRVKDDTDLAPLFETLFQPKGP